MMRDYVREALEAASNADHDRECGQSPPPCFCFRGKARFALHMIDNNAEITRDLIAATIHAKTEKQRDAAEAASLAIRAKNIGVKP